MIKLTHSQVFEIIEKLKPIDTESLFDAYLDNRATQPIIILERSYSPSTILKTLDRESYDRELINFCSSPHYLKIGKNFYQDFQVRELLKITDSDQIQGSTL